mgnify:CR=1 FL=1
MYPIFLYTYNDKDGEEYKMTILLCTLSLKFDKKCYLAVQLSKSKKKA